MRVSLITTVLNEEKMIGEFLNSVFNQTRLPDEIIIVDAASTDSTVSIIQSSKYPLSSEASKIQNYNLKFKVFIKPGNRAVGRNEAIKHATGDIIVCTDGDCVLDKDWVKNIIKPFTDKKVDVVAGYYSAKPNSIFQKCLVPYVLVMEDKINPHTFLPASRSMAFRKKVWDEVGGFPEDFSSNEDFVFANKIKRQDYNIVIAKDAVVYWRPRKNLKEAIIMFFQFAYGDMEAGIIRLRVKILFIRYFLGIFIFIFALFSRSFFVIEIIILSITAYFIWSIIKNYRYVKDIRACYVLPMLQLSSDAAVISGTIGGGIKRWGTHKKQ